MATSVRDFNMFTDVCDCTWGCVNTIRESALKVWPLNWPQVSIVPGVLLWASASAVKKAPVWNQEMPDWQESRGTWCQCRFNCSCNKNPVQCGRQREIHKLVPEKSGVRQVWRRLSCDPVFCSCTDSKALYSGTHDEPPFLHFSPDTQFLSYSHWTFQRTASLLKPPFLKPFSCGFFHENEPFAKGCPCFWNLSPADSSMKMNPLQRATAVLNPFFWNLFPHTFVSLHPLWVTISHWRPFSLTFSFLFPCESAHQQVPPYCQNHFLLLFFFFFGWWWWWPWKS